MKHSNHLKILVAAMLPLALAACGGSSSSDGPSVPGNPGSGSALFGSLLPNNQTAFDGIGTEAAYTKDSAFVDTVAPFSRNSATVNVMTDGDGDIAGIELDTGTTTLAWDQSHFGNAEGAIEVSDGNSELVAASPEHFGFDYQTFGAWLVGRNDPDGRIGGFSVGEQTAGTAIATSGSAEFTGVAAGYHIDSTGRQMQTTADANVSVDFANRSAAITTIGTEYRNTGNSAAGLDMAGTMTYGAGSNKLTGTATTTNGLTGNVDGRFYGPGAQEIGGVFGLSGAGTETYTGGFGAAR